MAENTSFLHPTRTVAMRAYERDGPHPLAACKMLYSAAFPLYLGL